MSTPRLVPELQVDNLDISMDFYISVLGFEILFTTDESRFAYLNRDGSHLMLEEASGPADHQLIAPLEKPYGRGLNLRIEIEDIQNFYGKIKSSQAHIVLPLEERWYRQINQEAGNRQFVVADPDGYLLRFFEDLGKRPFASESLATEHA